MLTINTFQIINALNKSLQCETLGGAGEAVHAKAVHHDRQLSLISDLTKLVSPDPVPLQCLSTR